MSNAITIIMIVGVAAVGIAYFANMFCQPSGGVLCFNPIPVAPAEDVEGGKKLLPSYLQGVGQLIGPSLGGQAPKTGLLTPLGGPQTRVAPGTVQDELRKLGLTPKIGGGAVKNSAAHIRMMTNACKKKNGPSSCYSEGWARCVPCGSTGPGTGSNFAESEAYYVRTA